MHECLHAFAHLDLSGGARDFPRRLSARKCVRRRQIGAGDYFLFIPALI
jgi:hypothetical protein